MIQLEETKDVINGMRIILEAFVVKKKFLITRILLITWLICISWMRVSIEMSHYNEVSLQTDCLSYASK